MNDTNTRRSIISTSLARFLSLLRKVNSETLETIDKENYQFQVADQLNSTFQQIKSNLELKKRNLLISCKDKLNQANGFNLSIEQFDCDSNDYSNQRILPTNSPINSTIDDKKFMNNSVIDFESSAISQKKSKLINDQSSSFTSNNTLDSFISFNTTDSSDSNLTSIQQSSDSGFSTHKLSNPNIVHHHDKLVNSNRKKDEQTLFISNLLYFLNLKNGTESADSGLSQSTDCDDNNLPETIALNLVKKFSENEPSFKIDPNELDCWLISEDEVPQKLLPIPNNVQFLTQHLNQAANLINEQDENDIENSIKNNQPNCSSLESNPIDIKARNDNKSICSNFNSINYSTNNSIEDKSNENKLIDSDFDLTTHDLTTTSNSNSNNLIKSMDIDEQDEMQKLNTLFHSGKFFNFSSLQNNVKVRGNKEWAAPRAMIHVVIHPTPKRQELIAKQNYRCCGCGNQIEKQDVPRMLYCYYTGKYFCKYGCHSQTRTIIPAYVINKWSFKLYPVSNFAFQVIQNNYTKPLFNIQDLNPKLLIKIKQFQNLHDLRGQLLKLKDYIITCKKTGNLLVVYLMFEPKHFIESSKDLTYSLEDLVDIKKDCKSLERCFNLVNESIKHIKNCSNCLAKGFICELCSNNANRQFNRSSANRNMVDILFPFEIGRVSQCNQCYACYHLNCFASNGFKCVKCVRIETRRKSSQLQNPSEIVF